MPEPRIVPPKEAEALLREIGDVTGKATETVRYAHTVATEPDRWESRIEDLLTELDHERETVALILRDCDTMVLRHEQTGEPTGPFLQPAADRIRALIELRDAPQTDDEYTDTSATRQRNDARTRAAVVKALLPLRQYAQGKAISYRALGNAELERQWLDILALADREERDA